MELRYLLSDVVDICVLREVKIMRLNYSYEPQKYELIEQLGDKWSVNLRENIVKDENYQSPFADMFPQTITDEEGNVIELPLDEMMMQPQEMWYADCYIGYIDADIEDKEAYIEEHFDELISQAKGEDKASEIRAMRDELLAQSDKFMVFDRLGFGESTTVVSFLAKLKSILTGDIAKYRQALRDITKQEGFPFNVTWPEKPEGMK